MFTMPAIHHSARVEGDSLGTLHLNALNGSSGFLGQTESTSNTQNGVFGSLFGASLSDNHPYRPQDSGMTFRESQTTQKKTTVPCCLSSSGHRKSSSRDGRHNPQYVDAATSPNGHRRHSLDLDMMTVSKRRNYNRKLSLDELVIGPFSRFNRFRDEAIKEHEQTSEPDLSSLSLTEVPTSTSNSHVSRHAVDGESKLTESKKKKKRSHTTDTSMPEKALKKVEKVKANKKDHNSNFKQSSQPKSEPTQQDSVKHDTTPASKAESLRLNMNRSAPESTAQQRSDRGNHSQNKDRKLIAKAGEN